MNGHVFRETAEQDVKADSTGRAEQMGRWAETDQLFTQAPAESWLYGKLCVEYL